LQKDNLDHSSICQSKDKAVIDNFLDESKKELDKLGINTTKNRHRQSSQEIEKKPEKSVVFNPIVDKLIGKIGFLDSVSYTVQESKKLIAKNDKIVSAIAKIPGSLRWLKMTNERENFLAEGKAHLETLLGAKADYQISLKYEKELSSVIQSDLDILGDGIVGNPKLLKPIREKIIAYSEEAKAYILSTAALIEKKKFEDFDEIITSIKAGEAEKEKIAMLFQGYRRLSFSIETIKVAVDFFSMINKSIVEKVSSVSRTSSEFPDLMFKNAILVYEFTSFLIQYLEEFGIMGIEDIEKIKQDVEYKLERVEEACKELENDPFLKNNPDFEAQVRKDNLEKRKIFELVKQKWAGFENSINKGKETTEVAVRDLIPNLRFRQKQAKTQLMALEIIAFVQAFQLNIELANQFADVKQLELAPLTAEDVCQLFGFNPQKLLD
jgi:hypothetical protein